MLDTSKRVNTFTTGRDHALRSTAWTRGIAVQESLLDVTDTSPIARPAWSLRQSAVRTFTDDMQKCSGD